ncbi:MAG: plastocyanin/azurin family copper-binding protein [Gemmatimonadota bacterium]|jgi:plastocyanin
MKNSTGATRRRRMVAMLVSAFAIACSQHTDPTGPDSEPDVVIELSNFEFSDAEVHVAAGSTVRWRNTTSTYHTVTPDGHSTWSEWQTASDGETFDVRFDVPGTYDYYCSPHHSVGMEGTIVVE